MNRSIKFIIVIFDSIQRLQPTDPCNRGVRRKKFRGGGFQGYGQLRGEPPRMPENLRKFAKNFLRKLQKMHYFSLFFKKISQPFVKLLRVWSKNTIAWAMFEKIFDENSIENLNFYLFLGKFVAKNKAFGNNIIFLHFFPVRGGGVEPHPLRTPLPCKPSDGVSIYLMHRKV